MVGLMMNYPLTVSAMLRRAEMLFGEKQIVSRLPDRSLQRISYRDLIVQVKQLSLALGELGVRPGDRVATLAWNHAQHLETYFAVPTMGAILHTLNPRLHPDDLNYIMQDAGDSVLLVDQSLLPLVKQIPAAAGLRHIVVMQRTDDLPHDVLDYDELIASADVTRHDYYESSEDDACSMCYTSGTTGRPKGVVYSHRALTLHSMASAMADGLAIAEADSILPMVPMFHVNAWGLPFTATFVGANQVLTGPHLDPASLIELCESERVTLTAGVPTVLLRILETLDNDPCRYDLRSIRLILSGGSAAPPSMIRAFQERHSLPVLQAWGMTETTPMGLVGHLRSSERELPTEARYAHRAKQGLPMPFVEVRARNADGLIPWDGKTVGELEVRGPWVIRAYYGGSAGDDRFTNDGWFRTGDVVAIACNGRVDLRDRAKDLVKSGGEWISSVALEGALMGHPSVAEAAVIAVDHPAWDERPLAVVVLRPGHRATGEELRDFLRPHFAKWWLPDAMEFVDEIPRTSAGKFQKSALRERFRGYYAHVREPV
jgi:acyl-CoA synthetase (AMP-forming)/AMP-acid ligase II